MPWMSLHKYSTRSWWCAEVDTLIRSVHGPLLAGVDEVGRGCLAGPVVAGAVVLPQDFFIPGIDDSKELRPEARRILAGQIRRHALAWSVCVRSADCIDASNILAATQAAAAEAVCQLDPRPDVVTTDALQLPAVVEPVVAMVRGDSLSHTVAAASILAKVVRDEMMVELDRDFPHYGFAEHKGYASAAHLGALERFGPCPAHRLTFASVVPRL